MAFGYTLLGPDFACQTPCSPCACPLFNGEPWTTGQNNLQYLIYDWTIEPLPDGPPVPITVRTVRQAVQTRIYDLTDAVPSLQNATAGPLCAPWFAWPLVNVSANSFASIVYDGGSTGPPVVIPYTTLAGVYEFNRGGASVFNMADGAGASFAMTVEVSIFYLAVPIFETTISFNYTGFPYSASWPLFDVDSGQRQYILTGVTMSNIPQTIFEVTPDVAITMNLLYGEWGNPNQPTNPANGNFLFRGFAYDGPVDKDKPVIFTVRAISTFAPLATPIPLFTQLSPEDPFTWSGVRAGIIPEMFFGMYGTSGPRAGMVYEAYDFDVNAILNYFQLTP